MQVVGVFRGVEQGRAAVEQLRARRIDAQHLDLIGGGAAPGQVAEAAGVGASTQAGPEESVTPAIFDGHLPPEEVDALQGRFREGGVALRVTTSDEHTEDEAMDGLRDAGAEHINRLS